MDQEKHNVEKVDNESEKFHEKKDHYHGNHHINKDTGEDDVIPEDFSVKTFFHYTKRSLTFNLTTTGIFLALCIVASLIDMGLEYLENAVVVEGVRASFRFLDSLVIMLAVSAIGPIFASIIGFVEPFIHGAIHTELSNPIQPVLESVSYLLMVWLLWFLFFFVFKNSKYHKDGNPKRDLFKRWTPLVAFVPLMSIICTMFYILTIYITLSIGGKGAKDGDDVEDWTVFEHSKTIFIIICFIFGCNILRFTIDYCLFGLIEPKLKILNHMYR